MSNKCSHALCFPKNMSVELCKIKNNKKIHFTTLHRRLFLIFVFKKKVMRQGKKAKNRIQFFYQFHINFFNVFFCSSIILSDSVTRGFRFFIIWLGGNSSLQAEVRNRKVEIWWQLLTKAYKTEKPISLSKNAFHYDLSPEPPPPRPPILIKMMKIPQKLHQSKAKKSKFSSKIN